MPSPPISPATWRADDPGRRCPDCRNLLEVRYENGRAVAVRCRRCPMPFRWEEKLFHLSKSNPAN